MLSEPLAESVENITTNSMSFKPSPGSAPSYSVSYGTVDAGIFSQEGSEIKYASLDRAGEMVANMPNSVRNTLLAPIQQGLIDAQSVFYLVDYSNDGGQIAISVEDFFELASNHANQPAIYEEVPLEDAEDKGKDTSKSHKFEENFISNGQQKRAAVSNLYTKNITKVHPSVTNETPSSRRSGPPTACSDEIGYDNACEPLWKRLIRLQCYDYLSDSRRRFTVASVLVFIFVGLVVAGTLVIWIFPSNALTMTTVEPKRQTTTEYQPPQNYTARCIRALCNATSGYCQEDAAVHIHEEGSERGCRNDGAGEDESDGCGWYLIHKDYHYDCFERDPGIMKDWRFCALDYECATRCVTQYFRRYKAQCPESMDQCECLVRNHVGGPAGYKKLATIANWEKVKSMLENN